MDDVLRILAVFGLVLANAFFVVSEYVVVSGRRSGLQPLAEAGSRSAAAALRLMDDPVRVISTVQVGITAIGILTGAIGEPLVRDVLGEGVPDWAGFLIAFSFVTYLSVVLGELVPKALTLDRAETLAMIVARPTEFIARVLRPVVWLLQTSAAWLLRPFGVSKVVAGESVRSVEELRAVVDEAEELGLIPGAQEEMLHSVFRFASREARDAMVPALDVDWLDANLGVRDALAQITERPHSRLLVAEGSLDRIVGVVHVRELIAALGADRTESIAALARPALIVPETKDLAALLREMRESRQQLAVVSNEYGVLAGIVTIEDIAEEIIGEIEDEYDLPDERVTWGDGHVLVAGSMTVDDFNETFDTALPQDRGHTLAGLVFNALGRGAREDDSVSLGCLDLRVEEVDGARIKRLAVGPLRQQGS